MKNNQHQGNEVLFVTSIHNMIHMEYNYIVPIFGIYSKARHTDMLPQFFTTQTLYLNEIISVDPTYEIRFQWHYIGSNSERSC